MSVDQSSHPLAHVPSYQPTLRDLLLLDVPVDVKVSPQHSRVAITVQTTNWLENRYENICYVYDLARGTTDQVNRSSWVKQVEWVDDTTLAILKQGPKDDDSAQIWLYAGVIGDGWAITDHPSDVEWFKPFAGGVVFLARHLERKENKSRADCFGTFVHFEQETSTSALYYLSIAELRTYERAVRATTETESRKLVKPVMELSRLLPEVLSIREVLPAPTGDALYLNCWARDDLVAYRDTSTYRISLDPQAALAEHLRREAVKQAEHQEHERTAEHEGSLSTPDDVGYLGNITLLQLPRGASVAAVAPDSVALLVEHQGRDERMYTRRDLWLISEDDALAASDADVFLASMQNISASLDREVMERYWTERGIFGSYVDGTCIRIAHFGVDHQVTPLDLHGIFPMQNFHMTQLGQIGMVGTNAHLFPEAYVAEPGTNGARWEMRQISDYSRDTAAWDVGTVETIRWTSKDGMEIEGVLRKPANFDPAKKYPLVFVVHGGPLWFSAGYVLTGSDRRYYPSVQFVHKDILVLSPNYRGSTGRGQTFAELNVNNLGIGDVWDIESAIDHLAERGWVDSTQVGCMGWSQGGYISAFAGLHTNRFRAVSVGAGISDWYTYHISNDIPQFTVDYLSGSPFRNRDLYIKTAPITNIAEATTPILIQHGANDHRVPVSNAVELYRGLQEMGVPVELFIFPDMEHPITKPRENHAVMYQNLVWFSHFLLGEELRLE